VRDLSTIPAQIRVWLENFVERPHPGLGSWPLCPYARQARINNRIAFVGTEASDLPEAVISYKHLLSDHDVVVMYFDHTAINPADLLTLVKTLNHQLMPDNLVILEDHPEAPEIINGANMNFGSCGLLILQNLSDLNSASDVLRAKGYYDTWSPENLAEVVNWRYKLNLHIGENQ
jgi:hypothetical protein